MAPTIPVYMDCAATTRLDPEVLAAMMPWLTTEFGNSMSQTHAYGWRAERAVELAREQIQKLLGATDYKVIFTSGATEANNQILFHFFAPRKRQTQPSGLGTLALSAVEHASILTTAISLENWEWVQLKNLPTDRSGVVQLQPLQDAHVEKPTALALMAVQNELGSIQAIEQAAKICQEKAIALIVDATQAIGKIPFHLYPGISFVSFSGHKINGPKGVGVALIHKSLFAELTPLFSGGGHESGRRSGTVNVPGIVGLAKALEIAIQQMPASIAKAEKQMTALLAPLQEVKTEQGGTVVNTPLEPGRASPYIRSLTLPVGFGDVLIPGIAHSKGSACSSGGLSKVLKAIGLSEGQGLRTIRLSIDRLTTDQDIDQGIDCIRKYLLNHKNTGPGKLLQS